MPVAGLSIGYARVSADSQDLTAQREALAVLRVAPDQVYVDHGLTGTNRERHLHQAGEHTIGERGELFSITRSTVNRDDRRRPGPHGAAHTGREPAMPAPAQGAGRGAR